MYRIQEALAAGAIPVLISDGVSLPYEDLLGMPSGGQGSVEEHEEVGSTYQYHRAYSWWDDIIIRIPERIWKTRDANLMLERLLSMPPEEILRRRKLAAFVYDYMLRTAEQRVWMKMANILQIVRKDVGEAFSWS
ncbi:unnamed protein product [Amoebophrya sp. A25]|nr:unnamed protein product [Amoebophrya sp. A25]|eukprot:GSA25T00009653001.1